MTAAEKVVETSTNMFNLKTRCYNQLNKPEPKHTIGGLRPYVKSPSQNQSHSVSPVNVSTQNRYATFEFTEDPFKNYRYDDLFNIDPFEEDTVDKNKNVSSENQSQLDDSDTGYETPIGGEKGTFETKFPKIDAFEANFPVGSDPFAADSARTDKLNGNSVNLWSNSQEVFSDKNSNKMPSDPLFSKKDEHKLGKASKAEEAFGSKKLENVDVTKALPNEELQLVWAAEESLRLEEERLKQEAQEKAEYEYALALSKKDSNRDKRTIRNLLRLGRNSPST